MNPFDLIRVQKEDVLCIYHTGNDMWLHVTSISEFTRNRGDYGWSHTLEAGFSEGSITLMIEGHKWLNHEEIMAVPAVRTKYPIRKPIYDVDFSEAFNIGQLE